MQKFCLSSSQVQQFNGINLTPEGNVKKSLQTHPSSTGQTWEELFLLSGHQFENGNWVKAAKWTPILQFCPPSASFEYFTYRYKTIWCPKILIYLCHWESSSDLKSRFPHESCFRFGQVKFTWSWDVQTFEEKLTTLCYNIKSGKTNIPLDDAVFSSKSEYFHSLIDGFLPEV